MAMRVHTLFLVWHIVQCAGKQCSDSVGTCSSQPRASLMQTRAMKKQALSAVEAAATRTQTLAGYKDYVNKLVAQYKEEPREIEKDGEVDNAITTIIQYINSMYEDLLSWHNQDEVDAEKCSKDSLFKKCKDELPDVDEATGNLTDDEPRTRLNRLIGNMESARKDHATCRQGCSQSVCQDSLACKEYNRYRKERQEDGSLVASFTDAVSCANPDLTDSYIRTSETVKREAMEGCLVKSKDWLDPLYSKYIDCHNSEQNCQSCQHECDEKQASFETAHCQLDAFRDITCDGYRNCYANAHTTCITTTCPNIDVRSRARAADNETGELIICLLGALRASEDKKKETLRSCDDLPNTEHSDLWKIECGVAPDEPPAPSVCGDAEQPCEQNFLDLEYAKYKPYEECCYKEKFVDESGDTVYGDHLPNTYDMINECKTCGVAHHLWRPHSVISD